MRFTNNINEKLQLWFKEKVEGITDLYLSDVERIGGGWSGWSSEIYSFKAEWTEHGQKVFKELVLRIDLGGMSKKIYPKSSVGRQFKVLKAVERANIDIPSPKALWVEEAGYYLGNPFIILEKLPGKTYVPWSQEGEKFFQEAANGHTPRQFVEILARLHLLDWEKYGLSFLGAPSTEFEQGDQYIKRIECLLDQSAWQPEPIFIDAICWAKRNRPKMERKVFMHGDYRTGNMLFDKTDIVGIVDWEASEIGDPNFEIGMICSKMNRMNSPLMCYLVDREFLYDYYEKLTGWKVNKRSVLFYETMYAVFDGLFWMLGVKEFIEGRSQDLARARGFKSYLECKSLVAEYLGY